MDNAECAVWCCCCGREADCIVYHSPYCRECADMIYEGLEASLCPS